MKRPLARRLTAVSVTASALTCAAAMAQVVNPTRPAQSGQPTMPGHAMPVGAQAFPVLLQPAADLQVTMIAGKTKPESFNWLAPRNAPAPERYVLCVSMNPVSDCAGSNSDTTVVDTPAALTAHVLTLPAAYNDRILHWTVGACGAGYGLAATTLLNTGNRNANCSWAPRRKLSIDVVQPPPKLPPPDRLTGDPDTNTPPRLLPLPSRPNSVYFSWVGPVNATSFSVCVTPPNVACGTGNSYVTSISAAAIGVPYSTLSRFAGQQVSWTVAACDANGCGDYKTPPGTLLVAAIPQPTRLSRPANGGTVYVQPNGHVEFFWDANPMATSYTLKVDGVEFPVQEGKTSCLLRSTGSVGNAGQPEGTARWSVKACNVLGCTEGAQWEMRLRTFNSAPSTYGPVAGGSCLANNTTSVRQ